MEIINRLGVKILEKFPPVYAHALLRKKSPLREWGWFRSFGSGESVDADGRPLPWLSYPAIEFLSLRIPESVRVFEYGSGNGTLWWAEHVQSVAAIEHDAMWFESVKQRLPTNASVSFAREGSPEYVEAAARADGPFDIIVIDGRDRVACALAAVGSLTPRGVFVWDDTNRDRYRPGLEALQQVGFRRIEFRGFSPVEFMMHETSILYRDGNCLGI